MTKDVELLKKPTTNPQRKKLQSAIPKTLNFKPIQTDNNIPYRNHQNPIMLTKSGSQCISSKNNLPTNNSSIKLLNNLMTDPSEKNLRTVKDDQSGKAVKRYSVPEEQSVVPEFLHSRSEKNHRVVTKPSTLKQYAAK